MARIFFRAFFKKFFFWVVSTTLCIPGCVTLLYSIVSWEQSMYTIRFILFPINFYNHFIQKQSVLSFYVGLPHLIKITNEASFYNY